MHTKKELDQMKALTQEDIKYWESQPKTSHSLKKLEQCKWFLNHLDEDYPEVANSRKA